MKQSKVMTIGVGQRGLLIIGAALLVFCCSNAGLQFAPEEIQTYDDQLKITGRFCTSPADELAFPVKILIVMDQSASLQCTDPNNNRINALNRAGAELDALPNVQFGVIGFASWSNKLDFTPDWSAASAVLAPTNGQGGPATDYQGSLQYALEVLEQDMIASGPAETARTKYIVLFLSDGIPEPRCNLGCDDGEVLDNGDTLPDSLYHVCNTTLEIPDGVYVDMPPACPEYNSDDQIVHKIQKIMDLRDMYGVGGLNFHTIFLFAPEADVQAACGDVSQFLYDRDEAEPLLRRMADEGYGNFRDVNTSEEIDFLDFDYRSLVSAFGLKEFFAVNMSAIPGENGMKPDSDRDGLDDDFEFAQDLSRKKPDSDGDMISDLIEMKRKGANFDPLDPDVPREYAKNGENEPEVPDTCRTDSDGDGLNDCEEEFLRTDPFLVDSDGDRMPDGLEVRVGTDPLVNDMQVDHDFDGQVSLDEIIAGTAPLFADEGTAVKHKMHPNLGDPEPGEDDRTCQDFSIDGITLVKTLPIPDGTKTGVNRIYILAEEEPSRQGGGRGRFHMACVEAEYYGESYKKPIDGVIQNLTSDRFIELQLFDPERHCLKTGDDPTEVPDGGML